MTAAGMDTGRTDAVAGAAATDATAVAAISAHGLGKAFGRREVLHDVSFAVPPGGFLALFGPNGAGKTTLLRLVATLLRPSSGNVTVAGHDPRDDPAAVRRAIGFLSHDALLYRDLTAQENLRFYADMYGVAEPARRVDELLARVELGHRRHDVVATLSKGMVQRLAIARALLHRPAVLLLDEPHAGLDAHAVGLLDALLAEIRAEHTFVMATHDVGRGLELADQVLVLDGGRVALQRSGRLGPDDLAGVYREPARLGRA
ncbi:MAG TPA: heme ABC exporter ATP-binding protein CcmA [Thermoleophilia bacterium]|nr:heme ABC exporter ATP-binding protein CcmA [Thermoleophilia bacterium]